MTRFTTCTEELLGPLNEVEKEFAPATLYAAGCATTLAVASHVKARFPAAAVRVFALIRTMSQLQDLASMVEPARVRVALSALGFVSREP